MKSADEYAEMAEQALTGSTAVAQVYATLAVAAASKQLRFGRQ